MSGKPQPLPSAAWRAIILAADLTEAAVLAERTWEALDIWPADLLADALTTADSLAHYASAHGISTLGDLVGDTEVNLRLAIADTTSKHPPGDASGHHWIRNVLISLRLTVALTIREPAIPPQRILHFGLEKLPARSRWPGRPLADDEAACLRLLGELDSRHQVEPGPQLTAFGLCGVTTSETSRIGDRELDLDKRKLTAPGHQHGVRQRELPLSPWSARIMRETRERRGDSVYKTSVPYAYRGGKQPGKTSAHSSASGVYKRMFHRIGIAADDLKPSSVELWLPYRLVVVENDFLAAGHVSGRSLDSLARALHLYLDHSASHTGRTPMLDDAGDVIAEPQNKELKPRSRKSRARPRRHGSE